MSVKEKIQTYLQSDRRRSIYVKELDETIFFSPVMVLEQERIFTRSQGGANSKEFHLATIIEKAENEEGLKLFSAEDSGLLEKLDWKIITRISNAIQGGYSVEKAKEELKKTPFDA